MTAGAVDRAAGLLGDRPLERLPLRQLFQLSIYWFGINAIWGGLNIVLQERVPPLAPAGESGRYLAFLDIFAVVVAVGVQPTVGSISDYTVSRWGRRKPYIAIGAMLDVVFLIGIATSQTYLAIFAFVVLLQFSSNFAQGPFQGYVPDLVPARAGRCCECPCRRDVDPRRDRRHGHCVDWLWPRSIRFWCQRSPWD